jgi:carboxyl-terminal processing protease
MFARNRRSPPPWLLAVPILLLVLGIWVGGRHPGWLPGPVRDALVGDKGVAVVREAIDDVNRTYYRKIPKDKLADASISGMVAHLHDRFSNYFDKQQYRAFLEAQDAQFSGVGMDVQPDPRGLRVAQVYDGSPAKRAHIVPGDVVVGAQGRSLQGMPADRSVALIKGKPGTDVKLVVLHAGRRRTLTLTRATVSIPVVASHLRIVDGKRIGVVRLTTFSSGAHADVDAALKRLLAEHAQGLVLDLRHNGGGLVSEAQLIASAFLKDGTIVTTRGRDVPTRTLRATGEPIADSQPMAVLVDRDTASAAEIVTGALQDRRRAVVVGTRTFGKGVFQEVVELSNGGALDITAGQYFTPSGRNLGGKGVSTGAGITPQVRAQDDPKTRRDEALDVALDTVAGRLS